MPDSSSTTSVWKWSRPKVRVQSVGGLPARDEEHGVGTLERSAHGRGVGVLRGQTGGCFACVGPLS